jgi:hypothetical protein
MKFAATRIAPIDDNSVEPLPSMEAASSALSAAEHRRLQLRRQNADADRIADSDREIATARCILDRAVQATKFGNHAIVEGAAPPPPELPAALEILQNLLTKRAALLAGPAPDSEIEALDREIITANREIERRRARDAAKEASRIEVESIRAWAQFHQMFPAYRKQAEATAVAIESMLAAVAKLRRESNQIFADCGPDFSHLLAPPNPNIFHRETLENYVVRIREIIGNASCIMSLRETKK